MISEWTVLEGLNRNGGSQLSQDVQNDIQKIRSGRLSEAEQKLLLDSLISLARTLSNMNQRAELETYCAVMCYARGRVLDAMSMLRQAQGIYHYAMDLHHQAIVEWLLFILHHGQTDYDAAFYWSQEAWTKLSKLDQFFTQQKDDRRQRWYHERVSDLSQDILSTPYYVHNLLLKFRGTRLGSSAQTLKGKIQDLMQDNKRDEACRLLDQFQRITRTAPDTAETAEAAAFIALQQFQMGNPMDAIRQLQQALAQYSPDGHESMLTRWMLGIIQYQQPELKTKAIKNLEECVEDIQTLAKKADHQNLVNQHTWYLMTHEAMRRSLKKMVVL